MRRKAIFMPRTSNISRSSAEGVVRWMHLLMRQTFISVQVERGNTNLITLLRHPWRRAISDFNYIRMKPKTQHLSPEINVTDLPDSMFEYLMYPGIANCATKVSFDMISAFYLISRFRCWTAFNAAKMFRWPIEIWRLQRGIQQAAFQCAFSACLGCWTKCYSSASRTISRNPCVCFLG